MKIIDQTPFYKEKGELSILDRGMAILQFGLGWFKEIEAQKSVIPVLDKVLDKNYTLLRNVAPAGLNARIPFILVGPTGVYVMYVTPLVGFFRAKGDQWGIISGNTFKPVKPNLLVRTERMARAIQVFMQRQGFVELSTVEAVLLCADPMFSVDSLRPIIRVVMRDALEYFAASIAQSRVVFSPENVQSIVTRLLSPQEPAPQKTEEEPVVTPVTPAEEQEEDIYVPAFALPESEAKPAPAETPIPPSWFAQPETPAEVETQPAPRTRWSKSLTAKQRVFLVGMFVLWCLIVTVIIFLVIKDLYL